MSFYTGIWPWKDELLVLMNILTERQPPHTARVCDGILVKYPIVKKPLWLIAERTLMQLYNTSITT